MRANPPSRSVKETVPYVATGHGGGIDPLGGTARPLDLESTILECRALTGPIDRVQHYAWMSTAITPSMPLNLPVRRPRRSVWRAVLALMGVRGGVGTWK